MKTIKLKDLEKTISGITEFVNEFKKSVLHKPVGTVKFVHSKFPIEIEFQVEDYSNHNDDLYLLEIGYKLLNGNKKLDITDCVHDGLFETLKCEDEQAIVDVKNQYREAHELITEFSEVAEIEINHFYNVGNKESELTIYMEGDHDCSYTIKIKGQKITVEDTTEEVRTSKVTTLSNLRERVAKLEHELGCFDEDWDEEDGPDDDDDNDEIDDSDEDWDDED